MPSKPKPIKITVTSGAKGQPITIRNRTNGEIHTGVLDTGAKYAFDLQNFTSGYTAGDVIDIKVSGERMGSNSLTTTGTAAQSVTVATSAITSGLSRGF